MIDDVALVLVSEGDADNMDESPEEETPDAAAPAAKSAKRSAKKVAAPAGKKVKATAAATADDEEEVVPTLEMERELGKADVRFFKELDALKKVDRKSLATIIRKCYCTPELGNLDDDEVCVQEGPFSAGAT